MSHKRRKGAGVKILLILAIVVLLLFVGFGFLFDINEIVVEGAYDNSPEAVAEASGIREGGNLFFFLSSAAEKKILDAFPYISYVSVEREFPGTVRISVSEGIVKALIEHVYTEEQDEEEIEISELYIMDENCIITEKVKDDSEYNIKVTGIIATKVKRGSIIKVDKEDETRLRFAQAVLKRLADDGYWQDVTWLDVSNVSRVSFDYMGKYTVIVGSGENLEYKLSKLTGIVSQLDPGKKGVIDLSEEGKAFFKPQN